MRPLHTLDAVQLHTVPDCLCGALAPEDGWLHVVTEVTMSEICAFGHCGTICGVFGAFGFDCVVASLNFDAV